MQEQCDCDNGERDSSIAHRRRSLPYTLRDVIPAGIRWVAFRPTGIRSAAHFPQETIPWMKYLLEIKWVKMNPKKIVCLWSSQWCSVGIPTEELPIVQRCYTTQHYSQCESNLIINISVYLFKYSRCIIFYIFPVLSEVESEVKQHKFVKLWLITPFGCYNSLY